MRNSKTIVIAAVLFLMLSAGFAMSGGGGQQPVKQEKGNETAQVQSEQAQQEEISTLQENKRLTKNSSTGTYIDKFGYDTGMTEEEFEKFKEDYRVRFNRFRDHDFYNKVDLSKQSVWQELGASKESENYKEYKEYALHAPIIIIGKVTSSKVVNNDSFYVFEIEEILKGEEIIRHELGEIPETILFPRWSITEFMFSPEMDRKGVYFFGYGYEGTTWRSKGYWITHSYSTVYKLDGGGAITRERQENRLKAQRARERQERMRNNPNFVIPAQKPWKMPTREEWLTYMKQKIIGWERTIESGGWELRSRMLIEGAEKRIRDVESGGDYTKYVSEPPKPVSPEQRKEQIREFEMVHGAPLEESFDEVIASIKKIIEINDHLNFYKKDFRQGGDHE